MDTKKKVLVLGSLVFAIFFISVLLNWSFRFTGFSIYQGGCSNYINSVGYWELDSDLLACVNNTGVVINSSDVLFDCHGKNITKSVVNSTGNISYGVYIMPGLENVVIQNCFVLGFNNSLYVGSGANVSLINSYGESTGACAVGSWSDWGQNKGCFDIISPVVNVTNQTTYTNKSFSYQVTASDISAISNYSLNESFSGNSSNITFRINSSSGLIVNISNMLIGNYSLAVRVIDIWNNGQSKGFYVFVLNGTSSSVVENNTQNPTQEDNATAEENNDEENDLEEDSSGAVGDDAVIVSCSNADIAWDCTTWGECINGEHTRQCTRKPVDCVYSRPLIKEACTVEIKTAEVARCEENWNCSWGDCVNGTKTALECTDLNNCNTSENKPTTGVCEVKIEEKKGFRSFLTGAAISSIVENSKSFLTGNVFRLVNEKDPQKYIRIVGLVLIGALLFLVIFFKTRTRTPKSYALGKSRKLAKKVESEDNEGGFGLPTKKELIDFFKGRTE